MGAAATGEARIGERRGVVREKRRADRHSGAGLQHRVPSDLWLAAAEAAVAAAARVEQAELRGRSRGRAAAAQARQTALYLLHTGFSLDFETLAKAAGRDRTTVGHACRAVEDRRDRPATDLALARLEASLLRWAAVFAGGLRP
jgi:hypothetical protein